MNTSLSLKLGRGSRSASPVYNNAALTDWRTALTNRATAPARIMVIGHSVVERYNAMTRGLRWVDLLALNLRTAYPTSGATGNAEGSSYRKAKYFSGDAPTAWNAVIGGGGTGFGSNLGAGGVDLVTVAEGYRYDFTGTSFEVFVLDWAESRIMSIVVDGGAPVLFETNGQTKYTSGALSEAAHTVALTKSSGGHPTLGGLMFYNGDETKGIQVIDAGRPAALAGQFMDSYINGQFTWSTIDLMILQTVENDYNIQTALATFKTDVAGQIAAARAYTGATTFPVLLLAGAEPTNLGSLAIPYASYIAKMKEVADEGTKVAVLDLSGAGIALDTDNLHPNVAGHATLGARVASALGL